MFSRIVSTLLLWGTILGSLWYFGPVAAVWILTTLAALTLHEFYRLAEAMGFRPFRKISLTFCVLMTAAPYHLTEHVFEGEELSGLVPALLALAVITCAVRVLGERDPTNRVETLGATLAGLVFVPFMLHYLVRLLLLYPEPTVGLAACLWVVVVAKFCDVGALLAGLAFGRHPLAPHISPKKTWEGVVGGVLCSLGLGAGLAWLGRDYLPEKLTPAVGAAVALPLALTTIVSDLVESAFKRRAALKDSGSVIPGIGGAFDLTDSLLLTAPLAYLIFFFLN